MSDEPTNVVPMRGRAKKTAPPREKPTDWRADLHVDSKGKPRRSLANVCTILSLDPRWHDVIAYDAFGECVITTRPAPVRAYDAPIHAVAGEWSDEDSIRTSNWLANEFGIDVPTTMVDQAVAAVAKKNVIHPVRDYLRALVHDGTPRLDRMLPAYFGSEDTAYTRGVGSRWMISAVARIFRPGCQADCTLVLESRKQGLGKSTGIEALATQPWFADTGITIGDKDSYQALRRKWIYELGEFAAVKGRDVERVKNFLGARSDNYRPSFGRRNRDFMRQCVFAATTNGDAYLTDRTGNRRFWPVRCVRTIDVEAIRRDRDQLWAEARVRFEAGEPWHVNTAEFATLCTEEQAERVEGDAWEEIVSKWLERPTVTRSDAQHGGLETITLDVAAGLLTSDVLLGALRMKAADITRGDEMRVAEVLRTLGFERGKQRRENGGQRVRRYFREVVTSRDGGSDTETTSKQPQYSTSPVSQPNTGHTHKKGNSDPVEGDAGSDRGSDGRDGDTLFADWCGENGIGGVE